MFVLVYLLLVLVSFVAADGDMYDAPTFFSNHENTTIPDAPLGFLPAVDRGMQRLDTLQRGCQLIRVWLTAHTPSKSPNNFISIIVSAMYKDGKGNQTIELWMNEWNANTSLMATARRPLKVKEFGADPTPLAWHDLRLDNFQAFAAFQSSPNLSSKQRTSSQNHVNITQLSTARGGLSPQPVYTFGSTALVGGVTGAVEPYGVYKE